MIYTSYFAKLKTFCAKPPEWYKGLRYKKLAPKYDFFVKWKCNRDNNYYIECFQEQVLNRLDFFQVYEELYALADSCGKSQYEIALVCYEKPSDFCHRHLVADWFNKNQVLCEEWR